MKTKINLLFNLYKTRQRQEHNLAIKVLDFGYHPGDVLRALRLRKASFCNVGAWTECRVNLNLATIHAPKLSLHSCFESEQNINQCFAGTTFSWFRNCEISLINADKASALSFMPPSSWAILVSLCIHNSSKQKSYQIFCNQVSIICKPGN